MINNISKLDRAREPKRLPDLTRVLSKPFTLSHAPRRGCINLTGQRFGRLLVFSIYGQDRHNKVEWLCRCDCGVWCAPTGNQLRMKHTQSCGCLGRHSRSSANTTHGATNTPEFRSYHHAKDRCRNMADAAFRNYGGRGIEFRFESFQQFLAHIGLRPTLAHSLDRYPNNNGHYEPGNVRWATRIEQNLNTRRSRRITCAGETHTVTEWANATCVPVNRIFSRLRYGWCEPCAVSLPFGAVCAHKGGSI